MDLLMTRQASLKDDQNIPISNSIFVIQQMAHFFTLGESKIPGQAASGIVAIEKGEMAEPFCQGYELIKFYDQAIWFS